MRKISLLFVLITVALLSSCVDDKESATVEQIRTAKTEWLKAQAEMLQAQGEAQKILAETEKLKAESEAKNEAARIEIERLLAESQAAKTEAEADELRAQAEKIKQEAEKIRIEYEYQQKLNELAYQTAQAKEAAKQQEFINRLNEAILAGKINKELQGLYADYVSALKTLRYTENQVSQKQTSITSLNKQLLASFDDHIKNYQSNIERYQIELAEKEKELKEFITSTENLSAEKAAAKINELKKEKLILRLPDSGTRNLFLSHLESNNMSIRDFNVILEVDNIATIKDLIRRGFGVSILAKSACLDELKKGKITVLPVENLSMTREINIVYHHTFGYMDILQGIIRLYNETVRMYRS